MNIRKATPHDLDALAGIESTCFPPEQAAGREQIRGRLEAFPSHFLLLCDEGGEVIAFIDGFVTDEPDLSDEMYDTPSMHNETGRWQMIFGLNTLPKYRHKGYASLLVKELLKEARAQGRSGAVLTCKESLIGFYERLGFINEGVSTKSVIGGVKWYQMRATF